VQFERLPEFAGTAREVRAEAFGLMLDRLGVRQHSRLFWAGCHAPQQYRKLVAALDAVLVTSAFEIADPGRSFVPHITLVRKPVREQTPLPRCVPLRWAFRDVVLVRLMLSASGPAYHEITRCRPGKDAKGN
jgi:2'-5' RNA ligase